MNAGLGGSWGGQRVRIVCPATDSSPEVVLGGTTNGNLAQMGPQGKDLAHAGCTADGAGHMMCVNAVKRPVEEQAQRLLPSAPVGPTPTGSCVLLTRDEQGVVHGCGHSLLDGSPARSRR